MEFLLQPIGWRDADAMITLRVRDRNLEIETLKSYLSRRGIGLT
jgi:hypothetical protein